MSCVIHVHAVTQRCWPPDALACTLRCINLLMSRRQRPLRRRNLVFRSPQSCHCLFARCLAFHAVAALGLRVLVARFAPFERHFLWLAAILTSTPTREAPSSPPVQLHIPSLAQIHRSVTQRGRYYRCTTMDPGATQCLSCSQG